MPLVVRALEVARQAQRIGVVDRVILDYEGAEVREASAGLDVERYERPFLHMGEPTVRVIDLVRSWLERWAEPPNNPAPELVCVLIPTSPLRTVRHLVESRLLLRDNADGVMSVTPFRQDTAYALTKDIEGLLRLRFCAADVPEFRQHVMHDGTAIWARTSALLALPPRANFYSLRLVPYLIPPEESVDVNTEMDLVIAEALLAHREGR